MAQVDPILPNQFASFQKFLSSFRGISDHGQPSRSPLFGSTSSSAITDRLDDLQIVSLKDFLHKFHRFSNDAERKNIPSQNAVIGLQKFLDQFEKHRRSELIKPSRPIETEFDQGRFQHFLAEFRPLAEICRRNGDQINIWSVAGLGRNEVRNASVLAWLLDSRGTHGRGVAIFRALMERLSRQHAGPFPLNIDLTRRYRVFTEHYSLDDEGNCVDLVIDGSDFVVFIEVKIDAREARNRLAVMSAYSKNERKPSIVAKLA
jgi:hypothetical protein